jgi:hypothetical protein
VTIPSKKDLTMLFNFYDTDGSGSLDYKEFTAIFLGKDSNQTEKKNQQYGQGIGYKPMTTTDASSGLNI